MASENEQSNEFSFEIEGARIKIEGDKFAAALDKIIFDPSVRKSLENYPVKTLAELGIQIEPGLRAELTGKRLSEAITEIYEGRKLDGPEEVIAIPSVRPVVTIMTRGTRPVVTIVTRGTQPAVSVAISVAVRAQRVEEETTPSQTEEMAAQESPPTTSKSSKSEKPAKD